MTAILAQEQGEDWSIPDRSDVMSGLQHKSRTVLVLGVLAPIVVALLFGIVFSMGR